MAFPASASSAPNVVRAEIDCPAGYVWCNPPQWRLIRDLRGCDLNDQTRSLKINLDDCD